MIVSVGCDGVSVGCDGMSVGCDGVSVGECVCGMWGVYTYEWRWECVR